MGVSLNIAEKLLENGSITAQQYSDAKAQALQEGIQIEEVLIENQILTPIDIVKVKSEMHNIPYVDINTKEIPKDILNIVEENIIRRFNAVPFAVTDTTVDVAMIDPLDIQTINYLSKVTGKRIMPYYSLPESIDKKIDSLYGEGLIGEVTEAVEEVSVAPEEIQEQLSDVTKAEEAIKKAPVTRIVNMFLEFGVKSGASDIHIEPKEDKLRVRFRVHGVLAEKLSVPMSVHSAIVTRIKILAKLKIDEKRLPQDGRFMIKMKDTEVDIRVSTLPTIYGEKVVMRLLKRGSGIYKIENTGLRGNGFKLYMDALNITSGIILITGPTGSGKTQTLASSLSRINREGINIITLEDPVEVRLDGINQVQINPAAGLTFASGLRSILRQDPDVVMVGEIRDEETARLAVQASLTGHLVFSTLHTNSAAGALPRLLDMGIEPYLIASTVHIVVAQRLPRKICKNCIESYIAPPELIRDIYSMLGDLNIDIVEYSRNNCVLEKSNKECLHTKIREDNIPDNEQLVLFKGKGCKECDNTGYSGRIGIFEVLNVSEKIGRLILENKPSGIIEAQGTQEGMITMIQDGYFKALEGITTIEEVLRVSKT